MKSGEIIKACVRRRQSLACLMYRHYSPSSSKGCWSGRTPGIVGKRSRDEELKIGRCFRHLVLPLAVSRLGGGATVLPSAVAAHEQSGTNGFTEVAHAYSFGRPATNGVRLRGPGRENTLFYNVNRCVEMFVGRCWMIIPGMAIAGLEGGGRSFSRRSYGPRSRTNRGTRSSDSGRRRRQSSAAFTVFPALAPWDG